MTKTCLPGYQIKLFILIFEQKIIIVLDCICEEILIVRARSVLAANSGFCDRKCAVQDSYHLNLALK